MRLDIKILFPEAIFCDGELEYSSFDGGYFDPDGGTMYYLTDWQGNNAAVVSSKGDIVQQTTYYPYGEPTVEPVGQRFLFGGKEREHAAGRNTYDFSARCLTPYGRWGVNDSKAEKFFNISSYVFCNGDPINFIDPDGKECKCLSSSFQDRVAMFGFKDDGSKIHVFAHGSTQSIFINSDNGDVTKIQTTEDFVKVVNDNFDSIDDLKNEIGTHIVLHSCWTGHTDKGIPPIAQKLSKELPNIFITAPDGGLGVFSGGIEWKTFFRGNEIRQSEIPIWSLLIIFQQNEIINKVIEYIFNLSKSDLPDSTNPITTP